MTFKLMFKLKKFFMMPDGFSFPTEAYQVNAVIKNIKLFLTSPVTYGMAAFFSALVAAALFQGVYQQYWLIPDFKKAFYKSHPAPPTLSVETKQSVNQSGLVFDLINMDVRYGVTSEAVAQRARQNVSRYLDDVKQHCSTDHTDAGNEHFIICAGSRVADHFFYEYGNAVTAHYAEQNSDCDASTYLLMTAAAHVGLETWIVYAPRHAFLAWKESTGSYRYWETTAHNNAGQLANFTQSLYKMAISTAYYQPRNSTYATQLYQSIIYSDANDRASLDKGLKPLMDNHFVSDILLFYKAKTGNLTKEDFYSLRSGLQEDYTSTDRIKAIAIYLLSQDNKIEAARNLARIGPSECATDCVSLLSRTSQFQKIKTIAYPFFDDWYDRHDGYLNLAVYENIVYGLLWLCCALASGGASFYFWRKTKKKPKREAERLPKAEPENAPLDEIRLNSTGEPDAAKGTKEEILRR